MKTISIRNRLVLLLLSLSVMLVGIGGIGVYGMTQSNSGLYEVYHDRTVIIGQVGEIRSLLMRSYMATLGAVETPDSESIRETAKLVSANLERADALWHDYADRDLSAAEREVVERLDEHRRAFEDDGLRPTLQALQNNRLDEAADIAYGVLRPEFEPTLQYIDELIKYELDEAHHKYEVEQGLFETIWHAMVATIVISTLVTVVVGISIIRAIVIPLNQAVQLAGRIADGDLTDDVEVRRRDETGLLLDAMGRMNLKLRELVSEITESSSTVSSEAQQIAAGNLSLSQRTEEQASSLEETAASMEEMTSTVRQSAENAATANHLTRQARESAEAGGAVVTEAVGAMRNINESSKKVAEIIGVIDEIAFQTNLLALNAAVEAARAGEQGRGFAVVASEVRSLAQRSASSAEEIKRLIEDSSQKVSNGTTFVEDSGATLTEIIEHVSRVSEIVAEIAAASEEQAAGIEQVNRAVMQLDELTQQNAAMVEEATASSRAQADLAQRLHDLVSQYRAAR